MRGVRMAVLVGVSALALGASQASAAPIVFNFGNLAATEIPGGLQVVPGADTVLNHQVSFTVSGATIGARAFSSNGAGSSSPDSPTKLVDVTQRPGNGTDESGLGAYSNGDDTSGTLVEISISEQLVLDVSGILAAGYKVNSVLLGSLQTGEYADVYGTNLLPSAYDANPGSDVNLTFIGNKLTGNGSEQNNFDLTTLQYKYFIFTADANGGNNDGTGSSDNLLINSLTVTAPPGTQGNCDLAPTDCTPLPEPITLSLFGAGLASAIAVRRRKLWRAQA